MARMRSPVPQPDRQTAAPPATPCNGRLAVAAIVLLALGLRLAWLSIFDIQHPDEVLQYLEMGHRLVTGEGYLTWEWRYGIRNSVIPQLLAAPLALGHALAPGTLAPVWLARLWFMALTCLALPAAWRLGKPEGRAPALVALVVVAVWWECVLYADLLLSESLSAALLLMAAALLLDPRASARALGLAGLVAGLAVIVRLQHAVFAIVLAAGALRGEWRRWRPVLGGGMAALALGALSDLATGQVPYAWALNNLALNIGAGRAAAFGTQGPLWYGVALGEHLAPLAPAILPLAWLAGRRTRPLFWAATANVVAHSLIGHKEYRFVWASALAWLVLAAIGSVRASEWALRRRGRSEGLGLREIGLLALGWGAASLVSAAVTGGIPAYRGGGAVPQLALAAARDPGVCGILVPGENRGFIGKVFLPRPVPLLLTPVGVDRVIPGAPISNDLAAGANALILPARPAGRPEYRRRACHEFWGGGPGEIGRLCLYVRPGPCAPTPGREFQQVQYQADM